jgi:hypothetical protein
VKRIKLLLLAALGALALTASMGASAASASGIAFGAYPATANGEGTGFTFTFGGGKWIGCNSATYDSGAVTGATETLPTTVGASECTGDLEGKVTVKMNGCKFNYHPAVGAGSFDIGPIGCGPITTEGNSCSRSIFSGSGFAATFSNEGSPSKVRIEHKATGLQYAVTKGSKAVCGSGGAFALTGTGVLKGFNGAGTQVDAQVVPGTGLYMTGKESGEAGSQPKFEAEKYPVTIGGAQDPTNKLKLVIGGNRTVECQEVYSKSAASGATAQLTLSTEFNGCTLTVLGSTVSAAVKTNGCNLVLHALNAGPPYSGSIDVACGNEGEAIEIDTYAQGSTICTYKISPQSGLTGVGLSNVGSGNERGVTATFGLSGIGITRAKGTLAACGGASQKATYAGATTLHAIG